MESQRFDESFKQAFDGAELTPSENVWTNVELGLEKASGGSIKRKLIMFQLLAAASTIFALGFGAVYYLNTEPVVPTKNIQALENNNVESLALTNAVGNVEVETFQHKVERKTDRKSEGITSQSNLPMQQVPPPFDRVYATTSMEEDKSDSKSNGLATVPRISKSGIDFRFAVRKPVLLLPEDVKDTEPDAGLMLLARLAAEEKKYQEESEQEATKEKLWTSVGFAGGKYDPNMSGASYAMNSSGRMSVSKPSTGTSYSVGVSVGHKLSKRVVIQGGIGYLTQSSEYSSNTTNNGVAALAESMKHSAATDVGFIATIPYSIDNNLQFISVPLQAGYVLIDRDFAVQLNGGVTTDLFLRNTLTPDNDNYKKVSQSAGEDSPYRSVNFNGLIGTEFSYRIAQQYRISLTPGFRYSLNSIYKSEIGTQVNPIVYDVSLRVRYIFK